MGKKTERLTSKVELAQIRVGKYLRKGESGKIESVDAYVRKGLSVPEAHQLKIAKDTLKMPGPMAGVMGGPSPDAAKKTVARLEGKINKPTITRSKKEQSVRDYRIDNPAPFIDRPKEEQSKHYAAAGRDYEKMLAHYDAKLEAAKGDTTAKAKLHAGRAKAIEKHRAVLDQYEKVFTHDSGKGQWAKAGTPEYDKEVKDFQGMIQRSGGVKRASDYKTSKAGQIPKTASVAKTTTSKSAKYPGYKPKAQRYTVKNAVSQRVTKKSWSTQGEAEAFIKTLLQEKGSLWAPQGLRVAKWGGPGVRPESAGGTFIGHDPNGSEIKVGSPVAVTGGPDKGERGTVVGTAKGGGIRVKVGTGVQSREMLVDPDELRVKSR